MMCWPGTRIGWLGISSWSFAKAMFEPQKETEPTTSENRIGISTSSGMSPAEREPVAELRPGDQRHGAAADAVVEGDHLRHLRSSAPRREATTPTAVPIAMPEHDQAPVADPVEQQRGRRPRSPSRRRRSGCRCCAVRRVGARRTPKMNSEKATM